MDRVRLAVNRGERPRLTLGIEEEFAIVDPEHAN